jgi:hypothetical protein
MRLQKCFQILYILICLLSIANGRERIALIVGANRGLPSERQLQYAVSDAKRIRQVLLELGKFTDSRCYLLSNPTVNELDKTLSELTGRIKEIKGGGNEVEFLFYYSGHGSTNALHLSGVSMPHDTLLAMIESVNADLTISIVDACYSGALVSSKGISIAQPISLRVNDTLTARGTIWLASSSSDQVSHESQELGGSVFTHNIISALRGAADYDGSKTISLSEAYSFARNNTSKITGIHTGVQQQPSYAWNIKGNSELCLSYLTQGSVQLVLQGGEHCPHFIISEPAQTILAEFTPQDNDVSFAVPSGRYRIQRVCTHSLASLNIDCSWKSACTLSLGNMYTFSHPAFSQKGPLDQPAHYLILSGGADIITAYPQSSFDMILYKIGANLINGNMLFSIDVGFGKDECRGTAQTVNRTIFHAELKSERLIYNGAFGMVSAGVGLGAQRCIQESMRPQETQLRLLGLQAPIVKSTVPFAGICGRYTFVLMGKIPLIVNYGLYDFYFSTGTSDVHHHIVPDLGVKIGWYFVN